MLSGTKRAVGFTCQGFRIVSVLQHLREAKYLILPVIGAGDALELVDDTVLRELVGIIEGYLHGIVSVQTV